MTSLVLRRKIGDRKVCSRRTPAVRRCPGEGPLITPERTLSLLIAKRNEPRQPICWRGSRSSASCDEDADEQEDEEAREPD